jgi:diphosphomevalonate decarboxylase
VTTAIAHPNIALIKYWGKVPGAGNVPASPSLSITLDRLATTTTVRTSDHDALCINGEPSDDAKVLRWLERLRSQYSVPPLSIDSSNNFPTGAGLASSASGFAALITAINAHCGLGLDAASCSALARQGSGSAARSLFGGFAMLAPPAWQATPLFDSTHWPLSVVIAITDTGRKAVSSSVGMERSRTTSPFYPAWIEQATDSFNGARLAIESRDFTTLARLAEQSTLDMHAVMLSSRPPLLYWNGTSVALMRRIMTLRESGIPVFFTIDAGPQIKAVCLPDAASAVEAALAGIEGVRQLVKTGLGTGARVIDG